MTVALLVDRPQRTTRFRWIAVVFVALLALGLSLAVIVYQRFVAYRPVAAQHVPAGSTFAARFDLTHVMLYEPFRRYLFPLSELGASGKGRRERLDARGLRIGADVREVVVAFGKEPSDWALVIGGPLVDRQIAATLASVFREEGHQIEQRDNAYLLDGSLGFAQSSDGALVLAASERRLRAALDARAEPSVLGQAAGGLEVAGEWLPAPLRTLSGTYRAGAVVQVSLSADIADGAREEQAQSAMKAVLEQVSALDPILAEAARGASIRVESRKVFAEVNLSSSAAERLAERVAGMVSRRAAEH